LLSQIDYRFFMFRFES